MSVNAQAVVARVRELGRTHLAATLASGLAALADDLMKLAAAAQSPAEERVFVDAIGQARTHHDAVAAAFEQRFLEIFDRKLRPGATAASAKEPTSGDFALVDDAAMELEVAVGRLAHKTHGELDADQLAGVAARLSELLGGGPREGSANPLGPENVLEALVRACDAVPGEPPVRLALVNTLRPHIALGLARVHPAVNNLLIAAGVLPRFRRVVQRGARSAAARGGPARAAGPGGASPDLARTAGPPGMSLSQLMALSQAMSLKDLMPGAGGVPLDLREIFGTLLKGPPAARHFGAQVLADPDASLFENAMATPVHPDLLAHLSQLQGAVLANPSAGPGDLGAVVNDVARGEHHPLDQLTGELVAVVFDFLLHDRDVPDTVKSEIARLQIVAFKAAVLDRRFFAKREHPLRELLTAIADAAADPQVDTGPESQFVSALHAIVDDVLATFTEDLAVFGAARERLNALVAEFCQQGDKEVEGLATELANEERVDEARARAAAEVAHLAPKSAPDFVRSFLSDTWTDVLADAEANARTGEDDRGARLMVVEDLLWSVAPKPSADVPRLTALLPKLVLALNRGMEAVKVPAEKQRTFLDELMQAHTALLQAARARRVAPTPPKPASPRAAPPPPPATQIAPSPELAADAMLALERGAVVEFADVNSGVRAKLTWISPKRTVYLFTAHGAKARRISPRELSAQLRAGTARLVEAGNAVVERALAAIVDEVPGAAAG
jgi:hypothetical protein